jgi:hypothetical protein
MAMKRSMSSEGRRPIWCRRFVESELSMGELNITSFGTDILVQNPHGSQQLMLIGRLFESGLIKSEVKFNIFLMKAFSGLVLHVKENVVGKVYVMKIFQMCCFRRNFDPHPKEIEIFKRLCI